MKKLLILALTTSLFTGCAATTPPKTIAKTDSSSVVHFMEKELNGLATGMKFSFTNAAGYVWWIADDGKNIFLKNAFSTSSNVSFPSLDAAEKFAPGFEKTFNPVADFVDETLTHNGFTKNLKNSSSGFTDTQFFDYVVAYEKSPTVCTLMLSGDVTGEAENFGRKVDFACSDELKKNHDEQLPFLTAYDGSGNKELSKDYAVTNIQKPYGDFTIANLNFRRTGFYAIFKKLKDGYQVVFSGQEPPPCKTVAQYKIPKQIADTCYSDDGSKLQQVK